MPDSTGRLPEAEGADEEVLDMPADEEEGVDVSVDTIIRSDDQGVLRIPLQGLRTTIAVIEQNQPPEK